MTPDVPPAYVVDRPPAAPLGDDRQAELVRDYGWTPEQAAAYDVDSGGNPVPRQGLQVTEQGWAVLAIDANGGRELLDAQDRGCIVLGPSDLQPELGWHWADDNVLGIA